MLKERFKLQLPERKIWIANARKKFNCTVPEMQIQIVKCLKVLPRKKISFIKFTTIFGCREELNGRKEV
jgi:hypothetical protein